MSTTEQRLAANRINALSSTGPRTGSGKASASQNATRHGLLSTRLFLEDERPEEFDLLLAELGAALSPIGAVELALVERVAVTLWRQRRLVHSETARLSLKRRPEEIARGASSALRRGYGHELNPEELKPFDRTQARWCKRIIAEIERLEEIDPRSLEQRAPLTFGQLRSNAEEDDSEPIAYATARAGGLTGYVNELLEWCREHLRQAGQRPQVLLVAEQIRAKRLILDSDTIDLIARYQTTLDNQLYKALRALREAQEWRLKTLEHMEPVNTGEEQAAGAVS